MGYTMRVVAREEAHRSRKEERKAAAAQRRSESTAADQIHANRPAPAQKFTKL